MPLADDVIVYPGHGAGSACGKNLSKETVGLLGEQKQTNYALRKNITKDEFIKDICCGYAHTMAITNSGLLYSWGNNESC